MRESAARLLPTKADILSGRSARNAWPLDVYSGAHTIGSAAALPPSTSAATARARGHERENVRVRVPDERVVVQGKPVHHQSLACGWRPHREPPFFKRRELSLRSPFYGCYRCGRKDLTAGGKPT